MPPVDATSTESESVATVERNHAANHAFLPVTQPVITEGDIAAATVVLRSGWIAAGPEVGALEEEFASRIGRRHSLACHSGAAALDLALEAVGIEPGDEVIVPSLTFTATAVAVSARGARPVFADVHGPDDLTLSPDAVAQKISPRTRAVIFVPYGGYAGQVREIANLCRERGLALIQDACHAPGAVVDGRDIGAIGDICTYSLHSTKNISSGEGGMVVFDNGDWCDRLCAFRSHGVVREPAMTLDGADYTVTMRATNLRMSDIAAAVARSQLKKLDRFNEDRRALAAFYDQELANLEIARPFTDMRVQSAAHLYPVLLPTGCDRRTLRRHMLSAGIETAVHFVALHRQPAYADIHDGAALPVTEDVTARLVSLPLHPRLTESDQRRVVAAFREGLRLSQPRSASVVATT